MSEQRDDAIMVDRCVCFDVSFRQLKQQADERDADFDELQRAFGCGRGCGMCVPYIKEMLRTGETVLPLRRDWNPSASELPAPK
ncbi:MAG: hypothetical protein EA377_13380 [Phycisphaerales bacterium]|nr:MAG: hypothetical protein EA377_13380 [Phycisphaerales bacterium]